MPATPDLSWDAVPGASLYQVWVNTDASSQPDGARGGDPGTTNTMYVPNLSNQDSAYPDNDAQSDLGVLLGRRPVQERRLLRQQHPGATLGHATNAFVKKSPACSDLQNAAADQARQYRDDLTFAWERLPGDQPGASAGRLGEKSHQAAMQYRIQVATDPDFDTDHRDRGWSTSRPTPPATLYPEGPLYWRVRPSTATTTS